MSKNIIRLKELVGIIKESVERVLEGIDVDINRNVKMTDKHENLVDTSVDNNPTFITSIVPNIKVWSIFKRKEGSWGDGNPLLYALKHERGYKLTTEKKFYSRLDYIVRKFFSENSGVDVTIAIPSTNNLNKIFAEAVASHCKNPQYIDNLFVKMSTEEVLDYVYEPNSAFRNFYGRFFEQKYNQLQRYFSKMPYDTFQFHKVEDMEMRKVIEKTVKLSDEYYGKYIDAINDKNVLIIDDSLTYGNTITEACKIISSSYTPKSITVLTLFSPLYNEEGTKTKNM